MIIEDPNSSRMSEAEKQKYISNGVLIDSFILLIYFIGMYITTNPNKRYTLRCCNITEGHINCLNAIMQNFRIKRLIVTPYILAEFLNRIRNDIKADYKNIKREFLGELIKIEEIHTPKNIILSHKEFIDFGNDISILIASEEHIKQKQHLAIISADGRFLNKFFVKSDNILAFNMNTLPYFFN